MEKINREIAEIKTQRYGKNFAMAKDKPHDPLCTMELEPETYRLIQVRGVSNRDAPKSVKNMISKYQTRLKKHKKRNVVTAA